MTSGDCKVLLIEDDPDASALMLRALQNAGPKCNVRILSDGVQAIEYLTERVHDPEPLLPSLVITDLKMPRATGFDVISWIRSQSRLSKMPVVVLTSSGEQTDIDRAMSLGANAYIEKPLHLSELLEIAKSLLAGHTHCQPK